MTPEEKAKQYADSQLPRKSQTVSIRKVEEAAFLAGHAIRDEEVKRLREALEWYADGIYPGDESYVGNELRNGKRARAALASQGEEE